MTSLRVKRHYLVSNNNHKYIIAFKAISAIGAIIKPMLILSKKIYLERFYYDLKDKVLMGLLDTRYINDELTYTYI